MKTEQKQLLKNAGIREEDFDNCYITDNNKIFTPIRNENGEIIKNGEEVYKELVESKDKEIEQTTEEKMLKQIADLKIDNMKKDTIINNTLKTIAELKVQVMELKGGN